MEEIKFKESKFWNISGYVLMIAGLITIWKYGIYSISGLLGLILILLGFDNLRIAEIDSIRKYLNDERRKNGNKSKTRRT